MTTDERVDIFSGRPCLFVLGVAVVPPCFGLPAARDGIERLRGLTDDELAERCLPRVDSYWFGWGRA